MISKGAPQPVDGDPVILEDCVPTIYRTLLRNEHCTGTFTVQVGHRLIELFGQGATAPHSITGFVRRRRMLGDRCTLRTERADNPTSCDRPIEPSLRVIARRFEDVGSTDGSRCNHSRAKYLTVVLATLMDSPGSSLTEFLASPGLALNDDQRRFISSPLIGGADLARPGISGRLGRITLRGSADHAAR